MKKLVILLLAAMLLLSGCFPLAALSPEGADWSSPSVPPVSEQPSKEPEKLVNWIEYEELEFALPDGWIKRESGAQVGCSSIDESGMAIFFNEEMGEDVIAAIDLTDEETANMLMDGGMETVENYELIENKPGITVAGGPAIARRFYCEMGEERYEAEAVLFLSETDLYLVMFYTELDHEGEYGRIYQELLDSIRWIGEESSSKPQTSPGSAEEAPAAGSSGQKGNPAPVGATATYDGRDAHVNRFVADFMVTDVIRGEEALELAKECNSFNEDPPAGMEYLFVKFHVDVKSSMEEGGLADIYNAQFTLVSEDGTPYDDFVSVAGLEPSFEEIKAPGSLEGYTYFYVNKGDHPSLVYLDYIDDGVWFAIE